MYQSDLEMSRRQKLKLKSTVKLDPIEVDFKARKDECQPVTNENIRESLEQAKGQTLRKSSHQNAVAYHIDQQVDAMNRESRNRNVVFVHCAMGRSRSATCVIMYIMKRFGVAFEDAFEYVKRRREVVDPNEGFLRQLRAFEAKRMDFGALLFNRQPPSQRINQPASQDPPKEAA